MRNELTLSDMVNGPVCAVPAVIVSATLAVAFDTPLPVPVIVRFVVPTGVDDVVVIVSVPVV
jgi:hypothetical protein